MKTRLAIESDGFAVLPDVFGARECAGLLAEISESPLSRSKAGVRHAMRHPVVAALANSAMMLSIAQQVLGPGALPFQATLFDKSSEANWLVVWHQDTALPLVERRDTPGWGPWSLKKGIIYAHAPATALSQVLALRVHLDDSSPDNGPLRVLPGTHNKGVLSDDAMARFIAEIEPTTCVVARGGVLAMRPLLVHASSKSRSGEPRRVLHIEYAASLTMDSQLELAIA